MNAAEKLMVVKGLIAGLQKVESDLKAEILVLKEAVGASQFRTELGPVAVSTPRPRAVVTDEQGLLGWVEGAYPSEVEVVRRVRPAFRDAIEKRLTCAGDVVIAEGGEVVGWAAVQQGQEYVSARLTEDVKVRAAEQVSGRLDALLSVLEVES